MSAAKLGSVAVPRHVVHELLEDCGSAAHVQVQLMRALAGNLCGRHGAAFATTGLQGLDGCCTSAIASFLPQTDVLSVRAAGVEPLCNIMVSHLCEEDDAGSNSNELSEAPLTSSLSTVHERIRVRLLLRRLSEITAHTPDEHVFETQVRSFVDESLRRRLEGEVAAAKKGMEEEVRMAKAGMLRCVQEISVEVDRRVHDKIAALQEEMDRLSAEQARGLREMIEKRVCEQTAALQAEVDRHSDCLRAAAEQRAYEQENVAMQLSAEVTCLREALESRIQEQEESAARLHAELIGLRTGMVELTTVRTALERRVAEQEAAAERLHAELAGLHTIREHKAEQSNCRDTHEGKVNNSFPKPSACFTCLPVNSVWLLDSIRRICTVRPLQKKQCK